MVYQCTFCNCRCIALCVSVILLSLALQLASACWPCERYIQCENDWQVKDLPHSLGVPRVKKQSLRVPLTNVWSLYPCPSQKPVYFLLKVKKWQIVVLRFLVLCSLATVCLYTLFPPYLADWEVSISGEFCLCMYTRDCLQYKPAGCLHFRGKFTFIGTFRSVCIIKVYIVPLHQLIAKGFADWQPI